VEGETEQLESASSEEDDSDEEVDLDEKKTIAQVISDMNVIMRMFLAGYIDRSEYDTLKKVVSNLAMDNLIQAMEACMQANGKDEWNESGRNMMKWIVSQ
jgi:hypothetical protein